MTAPAPRLRWLMMASHVPPSGRLGGIVRYTVELARALGMRDDVDLHLSVKRHSVAALRPLVASDDHLHVLPALPAVVDPLVERYALGPLLGAGFDVVHGVKHLLPRGVRGLTALTVHDMILLDRPRDFGRAKRTLLRRPYLASLRQADVPICVSAATRERLRAWAPESAERAVVTHPGSSSTLFDTEGEPVAALVGRTFGLVVGDPTPRKNVPLALAAWAEVVRQRPDALLVLIGPPSWGESRYGDQLADLEASGNLLRMQDVTDAALRWCYEQAAVVLCPSLYEGFGSPVVEAIDLGAPLLVSSDPAQVEAAAGRAVAVLPFDEPAAWARAVLRELTDSRRGAERPRRGSRRTYEDAAEETVVAVREAIARR